MLAEDGGLADQKSSCRRGDAPLTSGEHEPKDGGHHRAHENDDDCESAEHDHGHSEFRVVGHPRPSLRTVLPSGDERGNAPANCPRSVPAHEAAVLRKLLSAAVRRRAPTLRASTRRRVSFWGRISRRRRVSVLSTPLPGFVSGYSRNQSQTIEP